MAGSCGWLLRNAPLGGGAAFFNGVQRSCAGICAFVFVPCLPLFQKESFLKLAKMNTLDKYDVAILQELQADARLTNAELAQRVGLSAAPCWRRVRALEEASFIKGYRAEIDRHKSAWACWPLCGSMPTAAPAT